MADKMFENNQVSIIGEIVSDFQFSHEVYGEGFYMMEVSVRRLSDCMDYIPCICWGRNARFASTFEVGTHVQIWGRIQSRDYVKKLSETQVEQRTAYEVSVSKIEA